MFLVWTLESWNDAVYPRYVFSNFMSIIHKKNKGRRDKEKIAENPYIYSHQNQLTAAVMAYVWATCVRTQFFCDVYNYI